MDNPEFFCSICGGELKANIEPRRIEDDGNVLPYNVEPCFYCLKVAEAKGSRKGRKLGKTERNISWSKKSW